MEKLFFAVNPMTSSSSKSLIQTCFLTTNPLPLTFEHEPSIITTDKKKMKASCLFAQEQEWSCGYNTFPVTEDICSHLLYAEPWFLCKLLLFTLCFALILLLLNRPLWHQSFWTTLGQCQYLLHFDNEKDINQVELQIWVIYSNFLNQTFPKGCICAQGVGQANTSRARPSLVMVSR